jgi:hypothetical protein
MKPFQSRVVAAWIVALPIAYGEWIDTHHRLARLRTDAQAEIARQLHIWERASFVGLSIATFVFFAVLAVVIEALAKAIQRLFPDPADSATSAKQPSSPSPS